MIVNNKKSIISKIWQIIRFWVNPNPHGYGILRAPFSKTEISSA
jgi:hypothetical protein